MAIAKGDVVLVEFPFTDLSQSKLRPAVVLAADLAINEITLCFISSQQVDRLNASEFALLDSDPDFPQTGLRISSKVRVTRITTLGRQLTIRRLGCLGMRHLKQLETCLLQAFQLSP